MPTKKSPTSKKPAKTASPKKEVQKKSGDLKTLRGDLFSLKMKHALRELKEVHKLRIARRSVARHLTSLKSK